MMPSKINLSSVRVPVLSKAIVLIFPPTGIFLGSLIKIFLFWRERMELLTVRVIIMGNSGGTTVVMMRMQRRKSFSLLLSSFYIPWSRTYAEVMREQISRNRMIHNPSFSSSFKLSVLAITFLKSLPFEVSKPVESTMPIQPFFGKFYNAF